MLITINNVELTKAPKGYMVAEVKYVKDGRDESRKIMSFAAPAVYTKLSEFKSFPVDANVTLEKNGQFWNWTGLETGAITRADGNIKTEGPKASGRVIGSNYETPAERAARQVYIIKQSSISNAIEFFKAREPKGIQANEEDVLEVAERFKNYVLGTELDVLETSDEVV